MNPKLPSSSIPPILTAPVAALFMRMALPIIFGLLINGEHGAIKYRFGCAVFICF